jgi:hypothetical protein
MGENNFPYWLIFLRLKREIGVLFLIYESINLWAFVFIEAVPWPSDYPSLIRRWLTMEYDGELYLVAFYTAVTVYGSLFAAMLLDGILVPPEQEIVFEKVRAAYDAT